MVRLPRQGRSSLNENKNSPVRTNYRNPLIEAQHRASGLLNYRTKEGLRPLTCPRPRGSDDIGGGGGGRGGDNGGDGSLHDFTLLFERKDKRGGWEGGWVGRIGGEDRLGETERKQPRAFCAVRLAAIMPPKLGLNCGSGNESGCSNASAPKPHIVVCCLTVPPSMFRLNG
uniref:Uncharacterized protein n=1 Tax=Vespula pensylvanica TaxID=30213 RepID=A0A834P6K0_VESPE|nr:hypothetical protein H0235_006322 [Vespula pensylvanica]